MKHDDPPQHTSARTPRTYLAVIFTALSGNANVSLKPILMGSYVEFLNYSASSAGYLITAEASATSLGTALAALGIARWNRSRMVVTALVIIGTGNLLSLCVSSILALAAVRAFTGFGHGIALAATAASIASFRQPDRMAGIVTVGVSILGMSLIFFVPWAQHRVGIGPLFLTMAGLAIPPLLLLNAIPAARALVPVRNFSIAAASATNTPRSHTKIIVISLIAVGFFYISVGSFWPFAAQLGRGVGLSYEGAARVVAFAAMAAVLGALTAIVLGNRCGRMLPIACGLSGDVAALIVLLLFPHSPAVFTGVVIVYMYCWATLYPFLLGFASQLDPGGRVNGFIFSLSLIGFAIGPGLGSAIITLGAPTGGSNLSNLVWMSVLCLIPSFAIIYAMVKHRQLVEARTA